MDNENNIQNLAKKHPLATKTGITNIIAILLYQGDLCPKCGFGTRKTSKYWARCKKCGERIPRREFNNAN